MAELLFAPVVAGLVHRLEVLERLAAAGTTPTTMPPMGTGTITPGQIGAAARPWTSWRPPGEYTFMLDVPGLSKSDIQVTLEEDNVLVMKSASNGGGGGANGKRKREEEEGDCHYIRLERRASPQSFMRKFRLPKDADASTVAARCENDVLTVTVKKRTPLEKKTKSVQIAIT